MSEQKNENDKPVWLKEIEPLLADPADIRKETLALKHKFQEQYSDSKSEDEINSLVVDKIISNYSYYAAFVGGATGLPGIAMDDITHAVPLSIEYQVETNMAIAMSGGATANIALSMKYQIEMTMAIATVYGHNIEQEEENRLCFIIAGLGSIADATTKGENKVGNKAFIKLTQQYLKGATLQAVKEIFTKVGITLTKKTVEKAIPFNIGAIIGFSANKGFTWNVGGKAKDFFATYKKK